MTEQEDGPTRVGARDRALCCEARTDRSEFTCCQLAPLCPRIRVAVGVVDEQTIELSWAPGHQKGRLVAVHVHEEGELSFVVEAPLGLLLRLWSGSHSCTRPWRDRRSQRDRTSQFELLADGSVLLKCTTPDMGVLVPAIMVPSFKEALGLLLRLADRTVGNREANLSDVGGSMTTAAHCRSCTGERMCRTSEIGITLCARSPDGAIGLTGSGYFVHVDGHAAAKVRIAGDEEAVT